VRVVDDLDRLDARPALADLVRVDDERPDLVPRRRDVDGSLEPPEASMECVPGAARYSDGSLMNRVRQPIEQNA
jgi:hypothetical protein